MYLYNNQIPQTNVLKLKQMMLVSNYLHFLCNNPIETFRKITNHPNVTTIKENKQSNLLQTSLTYNLSMYF